VDLAARLVDLRVHESGEGGVLADVAVLAADAEEDEAGAVGAEGLEAPEEASDVGGGELAVEAAEGGVEVGEGDADAGGLAVDGDDQGERRVEEEPHVAGHLLEFGLGHGDEAPVVGPGVVEDLHADADVALGVPEVDGAPGYLGEALDLLGGAAGAGGDLAGDVAPGEDVLELGVAGLLDEAALVGAVVGHEDHRRGAEAVDEAADLLVDAEAHGAPDGGHPAGAVPALGGAEQGLGDGGVVDGVEEAEEAGAVPVVGEVLPVDLGGAAPHRLPVAVGDHQNALGVEEEGVFGREALGEIQVEGADPVGIVAVDVRGEIEEIAEEPPALGALLRGAHLDRT
jgi:hypothetical protein